MVDEIEFSAVNRLYLWAHKNLDGYQLVQGLEFEWLKDEDSSEEQAMAALKSNPDEVCIFTDIQWRDPLPSKPSIQHRYLDICELILMSNGRAVIYHGSSRQQDMDFYSFLTERAMNNVDMQVAANMLNYLLPTFAAGNTLIRLPLKQWINPKAYLENLNLRFLKK